MTTGISNDVRVKDNFIQTESNSVKDIGSALSTGNIGTSSTADNTNVESNDNKHQTEINELKAKINNLCNILGKSSSQIFSIFGQNVITEEKLSVNECKKRLEALNAAIKDATINGKLDKEKAVKLAKDYVIALNTGWSIDGLKNQNKKFGKTTLLQRLIHAGFLKKTSGEVSETELQNAVEKYFDSFNKQLNNAKTKADKEKIIKIQLQTFGRLLINTEPKERTVFTKVMMQLFQQNRLDGTKAVFASLMTDEQKQLAAKEINELMPKIAKGLSNDDVMSITITYTRNLSKEDKLKLPDEIKSKWEALEQQYNKDDIQLVKDAIRQNRSKEDLPKNCQPIYDEIIYLYNVSAGQEVGLAGADSNFTKNERFNLNQNYHQALKNNGEDVYNAVQQYVAEIIDNHPELLDMSQKEFAAFMDDVSGGQFSFIVNESGKNYEFLKSSGNACSSTGLGLEQKTTQENYFTAVAAVDEKIQQLYREQKDNNFASQITVEKNEKQDNGFVSSFKKYANIEILSGNELIEGIANRFIKIGDVLNKYNELTQSGQDFINKLIESMSTGIQNYFLNGLKDNIVVKIASHAHIDLSKLNLKFLTYDSRKQVEHIQESQQHA